MAARPLDTRCVGHPEVADPVFPRRLTSRVPRQD